MGVLKVLVDGVWRKVGCGDNAPVVYFADDFNRADGASLGSPWVVSNADGTTTSAVFGIDTNRAQPQSSKDSSNEVVAWVPSLGSDVDISVTLSAVGNNSALVVRLDPSIMRYHYFYFGSSPGYMVKSGTSNGTWHSTPGMLATAGDVVRVVAVADAWTVYKNGVVITTFTNSLTQTADCHGLAGIPSSDSVTRFDDFTVSATTPAPGRLRLWTGSGWVREACDDDGIVVFSDNFNRANESPVAVSSSGASWETAINGGSSVVSNRLRLTALSNPSVLLANLGSATQDFTVRVYRPSTSGYGYVFLASPQASTGPTRIQVMFDGSGYMEVYARGSSLGYTFSAPYFVGSSALIRVTYNPSTNVIKVYVNGVQQFSVTYGGTALTGTYAGIGSSNNYSDSGMEFDDVTTVGSASPVPVIAHPLKIEDPDNPGTWITVACMVPI